MSASSSLPADYYGTVPGRGFWPIAAGGQTYLDAVRVDGWMMEKMRGEARIGKTFPIVHLFSTLYTQLSQKGE